MFYIATSAKTGKPFKVADDHKTLVEQKTVKTSSIFHENFLPWLKQSESITVCAIQSNTMQELTFGGRVVSYREFQSI